MTVSSIDADAFRQFERDRHDVLAQSYHAFFAPITALAHGPLLEAVHVSGHTRLLDVATGSGGVARRAADLGARTMSVDLSPNMITLASMLHPYLAFQVADAESLPFENGSFDAVVCNFGLGHFPSAERAMAECVRVLRPGGRLAVSWWDEPSRQRLQGLFLDALQEAGAAVPPTLPPGPPLFRFSADSALSGLLQTVGLSAITVHPHATSYTVRDTDTLWVGGLGSLARTSAVVLAQTPAMQKRIREAFHRLANDYASAEGLTIPIAFKVAAGQRGSREPES
jgi:SAM-dependent methyltransferase